ncbi:MAG TPA: hypothetical protein VLE96_02195 [Chlamydiales bacterium]|nr:hypothetical protein [Chlamydiales bacterium]
MQNPAQIEQAYKDFMSNLPKHAHDGIVSINLRFLHDQGLLDTLSVVEDESDDLTQFFHVIESPEKVTLFNEHFVVWIIPKMEGENPVTFVLIATNQEEKAHLEVVFTTYGVYNSPRYVLRVLQHFLSDMLETEETLTLFEKNG